MDLGRLQMRPLCTLTGFIAVIILLLLNTSNYADNRKTKVKKKYIYNKTSLFAIKTTFAKRRKKTQTMIDSYSL